MNEVTEVSAAEGEWARGQLLRQQAGQIQLQIPGMMRAAMELRLHWLRLSLKPEWVEKQGRADATERDCHTRTGATGAVTLRHVVWLKRSR